MLAAIRIGPNRHISGILWQQDLVITSDQALPAQDNYTLVLPGGVLTAARPARRNAAGNLASLRLEGDRQPMQITAARGTARRCTGAGAGRRRRRRADGAADRRSTR